MILIAKTSMLRSFCFSHQESLTDCYKPTDVSLSMICITMIPVCHVPLKKKGSFGCLMVSFRNPFQKGKLGNHFGNHLFWKGDQLNS